MSLPTLIGIVAMDSNRIIGVNNSLPWNISEDLQFFKKQTSGSAILMGRKTFESIGKPLPNRRNIVLTRDLGWAGQGVEAINSIEDLKNLDEGLERLFIIGGSEIYQIFLPYLNELIVSAVHREYEGDTFFPEFEHFFEEPKILEEFEEFTVKSYGALEKRSGTVIWEK